MPFKIYADTECNLEKSHINNRNKNTSRTEKYWNYIPCSFAYKRVLFDDKFSKPVVFNKSKNKIYKLIEAILDEYGYCKQMIKKHFNKNLIMPVEDEKVF